ncbi:MAG: hypothetical protein LBR12_05080, partial [Opitutaceae bacterium]|nr:hypothetical protein [Opitutaceae bacterium]
MGGRRVRGSAGDGKGAGRRRRFAVNRAAGGHENAPALTEAFSEDWVQGLDLNQRPSGYEPDEL